MTPPLDDAQQVSHDVVVWRLQAIEKTLEEERIERKETRDAIARIERLLAERIGERRVVAAIAAIVGAIFSVLATAAAKAFH